MRKILWLATAAILALPGRGWCRQTGQAQGQQQSQQPSQPQAQAAAPQQESLADAARRAREQKKEAPKAAKVFTNDDMSAASAATTSQPTAAAGAETAAPAGAASTKGDEKSWRDKFATLRAKLDHDQADLAVMQRELGILNTQNYSDPVKAMQQGLTREDINKKTADINAKTKAIAADKQAISDAEDDLRKSGGDPGWAR